MTLWTGTRGWSEGGSRHRSGQADVDVTKSRDQAMCFKSSRRSRAGIVIAVSSASLIRIRPGCNDIVPLVLATRVLKQTQGKPV
jgi:hypothetical protein